MENTYECAVCEEVRSSHSFPEFWLAAGRICLDCAANCPDQSIIETRWPVRREAVFA